MREKALLLIATVLFGACGGGTGNEGVSDDGPYRFEYELHDGSGTVLVVADSDGFAADSRPRVYVDGEYIGESDPSDATSRLTPPRTDSVV